MSLPKSINKFDSMANWESDVSQISWSKSIKQGPQCGKKNNGNGSLESLLARFFLLEI